MDILPQLLVNALIAGSIYALASAGLALTYGLLRVLNFAHGHLMMVGAYIFFFFSVEQEMGLVSAGICTLIFAVAFGALILRVFVLPFSRYSFLLSLVSTIALASMLESLVSMGFGVNVKSLSPGSIANSIEFYGIYITPLQIIIILSAIIILGLVALVIHSSGFGRRIRALAEDPHAAQSLGISRRRMSYSIFILATIISSYAGVLVGYETNMQPTMGTSFTIKAFAAMILGGLGNLWGTVAGSYFLGLVENLSIGLDFGGYSIPAGYKDAFAFFIILIVLLFKPEGIFSKKRREN